MDLELAEKVAVVTGANKGIGFAVTQALLAERAYVVAGALNTRIQLEASAHAPWTNDRRLGRLRK